MQKAAIEQALDAAILALNDWVVTYAPEFSDDVALAAAHNRLNANGVLWYISTVIEQCNKAKELSE